MLAKLSTQCNYNFHGWSSFHSSQSSSPGQSRDLTDFEGLSRDPGITLACPGISCFSTEIASYSYIIYQGINVASVSTNSDTLYFTMLISFIGIGSAGGGAARPPALALPTVYIMNFIAVL